MFDGACKGNPGPSAYGFVLESPDGSEIEEYDQIGTGTNNEAEYEALIRGLKRAVKEGVSELVVKGDSKLVVNQVFSDWDVNEEGLQSLHAKALELVQSLESVRGKHVSREENKRADELADRAFN